MYGKKCCDLLTNLAAVLFIAPLSAKKGLRRQVDFENGAWRSTTTTIAATVESCLDHEPSCSWWEDIELSLQQ